MEAAPVASLQMLLSPHPGPCTGLAGPCLCSSPRQTLLSSHLNSISERCWVMTLFTPRRHNSAPSLRPCHVPGCVLYLFKAPRNIAEPAFDSHANCWTYSIQRQAILSRQVAPCLKLRCVPPLFSPSETQAIPHPTRYTQEVWVMPLRKTPRNTPEPQDTRSLQ